MFTKFEVFLHPEIGKIIELESLLFLETLFPQVFLFQVQFPSFASFRSKLPRQWILQDINPSTVFYHDGLLCSSNLDSNPLEYESGRCGPLDMQKQNMLSCGTYISVKLLTPTLATMPRNTTLRLGMNCMCPPPRGGLRGPWICSFKRAFRPYKSFAFNSAVSNHTDPLLEYWISHGQARESYTTVVSVSVNC